MKRLAVNLNPAFINLIIAGISVFILNARVVLFDIDTEYHRSLAHKAVFDSVEFKVCLSVLITTTIPVILDGIMDIFTGSTKGNHRWFIFGRMLIAISNFTMGLQFTLCDDNFLIRNFWIILWSRRFLSLAAVMFCTNILKPSICTIWQTTLVTTLMCGAGLFQVYGNSEDSRYLVSLGNKWIPIYFVVNFVFSYWWAYKFWLKPKKEWKTDDYFCVLYLLLFFLISHLVLIIMIGYKIYINIYSDTSKLWTIFEPEYFHMLSPIYIQVVYMVILNLIPGRIARLEVIAAKDNIIVTKKKYVRYISHELRTPMSVIKMGLKFFKTQFRQQQGSELTEAEREQQDTLAEMEASSEVAVEILNDLLLYDKIESGLVVLQKQCVNTLDFIQTSLLMFAVQIRSKKIDLQLMNVSSKEDSETIATTHRESVFSAPQSASSCSMTFSTISCTSTHSADGSDASENAPEQQHDVSPDTTIHPTDVLDIDKAKMGQVIRNIMSNAIKFTPDGGRIQVSLKFESSEDSYQKSDAPSHERKGWAVLQIKDSGAGMSLANQARLFGEIIQFKPEVLQSGGGSGLGLYISKALVDLHGGKLSASSEGEGKGSTFRLEIPMTRLVRTDSAETSAETETKCPATENSIPTATSEDVEPPTVSAASAETAASMPLRDDGKATNAASCNVNVIVPKWKFLVVDDVGSNRKMLCRSLVSRGHCCEQAENGKMALEMVEKNLEVLAKLSEVDKRDVSKRAFDAILTDWVMPVMDGLDATAEIRKLGFKGPIVGLTGNALEQDRERFMKAGASHVFVKPFDIDVVLEAMDKCLE